MKRRELNEIDRAGLLADSYALVKSGTVKIKLIDLNTN